MTPEEQSDALHARVVDFGLGALAGRATRDTFDDLAADIAAFQYECSPGFRRLVDARGADLSSAAGVPAVPTDAFRLGRVAAHPAELDEVRFSTSGTTGDATGFHPMRRTTTYRTLSTAFGRLALMDEVLPRPVVVALCPEPSEPPSSSLAFMALAFMEAWDGRGLDGGARFDAREAGRWLARPGAVDVAGLQRVAALSRDRGAPLVIVATGFSLVLLLDALGGGRLPVGEGSVVMLTGGFKGRTREVAADVLVAEAARALDVDERRIVGEYGMTELSSQLYEGTLPGGRLAGPRGVFRPPPWLAVSAVDPVTLEATGGEAGLARFVDLANVDSALAVLTEDRVRLVEGGVELLGRQPGAPPRGCSLSLEQMIR